MTYLKIEHVALHVPDVAAAAEFYVETFGFARLCERAGTQGDVIAFLTLGDSMLELTPRPDAEPMSGFHLCLQPDDFDAAIAALRQRDLPIVTAPRSATPRTQDDPFRRRAVFRGPHGELIEIRGK